MPYEPKYTPNPTKRFDISEDEYSRGRLAAIRECFEDLRNTFPSVGIALFGSLSKGKVLTQESHKISDVDVDIFIDANEIPDHLTKGAIREIAQEMMARKLYEKEPLSKRHMTQDIHVIAFDAKKIVDDLAHINPKTSEESADMWYDALDDACKLFHLDVGGGLAKFRKALLSEIKAFPEGLREKVWSEIAHALIITERNKTEVSAELARQYPATFEEALRYYHAE